MRIENLGAFNPICQSPAVVMNRETVPSPSGLSYKPCIMPIAQACGISIGRKATATDNGGSSAYAVGFSGGASGAGTWILALLADDGSDSNDATFVDQTGWTKLAGGVANDSGKSIELWIRLCGSTEPSTYGIVSDGYGACCSFLEILGANSSNPDVYTHATNTGTPPSAVSSNACDCAILCVGDFASSAAFTTPSGYTAQGQIGNGAGTTLLTKMASMLEVGSGTISPPAWGSPETSHSYLWTVLFKQ